MKWQLMTDGNHINVVGQASLDEFCNKGYVKVGPVFDDRSHANEHVTKIKSAMKGE
ncbi:hypothetical protein ACFQ3W_24935 [Paenibacillus puldeungensis]|uniref:Uncharacterized protein n=1 Tax=Paenibacillus puldeungensis TaxID=696536 RepID=A0ABW3S568_9BACL